MLSDIISKDCRQYSDKTSLRFCDKSAGKRKRTMVDFKAKIKDVPDNPGVYMMLDENGEIIYVGKAKNLKNRLRSYFFNAGSIRFNFGDYL